MEEGPHPTTDQWDGRPASRTGSNTFLLFTRPLVWGAFYSSSNRLRWVDWASRATAEKAQDAKNALHSYTHGSARSGVADSFVCLFVFKTLFI